MFKLSLIYQPLIFVFSPRPLDLSASDRLIALENLNILQLNGFEVKVQQTDSEGNEESSAEQLALVSQPVSKSTVFDMSGISRNTGVIINIAN